MNDQDKQLMDELNSIMVAFVNQLQEQIRNDIAKSHNSLIANIDDKIDSSVNDRISKAKQSIVNSLEERLKKESQTEAQSKDAYITSNQLVLMQQSYEELRKDINKLRNEIDTFKQAQNNVITSTQMNATPTNELTLDTSPPQTDQNIQPVLHQQASTQTYSEVLGVIAASETYKKMTNSHKSRLLDNFDTHFNYANENMEFALIWLVLVLELLYKNKTVSAVNIPKIENFIATIRNYNLQNPIDASYLQQFKHWFDKQKETNNKRLRDFSMLVITDTQTHEDYVNRITKILDRLINSPKTSSGKPNKGKGKK